MERGGGNFNIGKAGQWVESLAHFYIRCILEVKKEEAGLRSGLVTSTLT